MILDIIDTGDALFSDTILAWCLGEMPALMLGINQLETFAKALVKTSIFID